MKNVYFIGAGGIGMSNLIRYYLHKGCQVAGYDRTETSLTCELAKEGAALHFEDNTNLIPAAFRNPQDTLVVYTPAIPADHCEKQWFAQNGFKMVKRAELLGIITRSSQALCIAGTHGKTTTSTMTAHLLASSHVGCTAFLGGVSKNYRSNLLLSPSSPYTVIEADEYDRSFHHLLPYCAVITSTDPDHLDIYGTREAYLESFRHFASLISKDGLLLRHINTDSEIVRNAACRIYTYGRTQGDYHAENIRIGGGRIVFNFTTPTCEIRDIELGVPVSINIDNAIAAIALALQAGATAEECREAMRTYAGVERRFDFSLRTPTRAVLCDYAHHPSEIAACIQSLRDLYPRPMKIAGVFQPHLYSRTQDFYQEFATALSALDELVLTPIYPAREQPIEGVTSELIAAHMQPTVPCSIISKNDLSDRMPDSVLSANVIVVLGAGDIDLLTPQIAKLVR